VEKPGVLMPVSLCSLANRKGPLKRGTGSVRQQGIVGLFSRDYEREAGGRNQLFPEYSSIGLEGLAMCKLKRLGGGRGRRAGEQTWKGKRVYVTDVQ